MPDHSLLPLGEVSFYILLSLASKARHGYAIMKDVEKISDGSIKLSTSTLYDALERLLEQGLIVRLDDEPESNLLRPRKEYRLNELGRQVLIEDSRRMQSLVNLASRRLPEITG